jgi:hypothetical protein
MLRSRMMRLITVPLGPEMAAFSALLFLWMVQAAPPASIPAGTHVEARIESSVKTADSKVGDPIVAIVARPIRAAEKVVIPEGARLNGRIETIEPATVTNEGRVRLAFREIQFPDGRSASTWITNSFSASPPKPTRRYVLAMGIGAAAGAVIGQHAARTAGIIGGTLVGFVIANNSGGTKRSDLELRSGQKIVLEFREDFIPAIH